MFDKYIVLNMDWSIGIIIVEVVICLVIGVLGLFGNVLVFLVVVWCLKFWILINVFIVGFVVCDIFIVLICVFILLVILVLDGWISNFKFLCYF